MCVFVGVLRLKQVGGSWRFFCSDICQVQVTTSHIEKATMNKDSISVQAGLRGSLIAHPS